MRKKGDFFLHRHTLQRWSEPRMKINLEITMVQYIHERILRRPVCFSFFLGWWCSSTVVQCVVELLSPAVRQMMDRSQRQNFFSQKRQLFSSPLLPSSLLASNLLACLPLFSLLPASCTVRMYASITVLCCTHTSLSKKPLFFLHFPNVWGEK